MVKKVDKSKVKRVIRVPVEEGKLPVRLIREAIRKVGKVKEKKK